jgi:hypothetical protein
VSKYWQWLGCSTDVARQTPEQGPCRQPRHCSDCVNAGWDLTAGFTTRVNATVKEYVRTLAAILCGGPPCGDEKDYWGG